MSDGNAHNPTNFSFIEHAVDDFGADVNGKYGYAVGGITSLFSAGATLNVGDLVYLSAANTVNKSAVAATVLGKLMGVVVGGWRTDMKALTRKLDVGTQAALVNEAVIVLSRGKYWVVSGAAITAADILTADTGTAGRVKTGTVTTDLVAGDSGRIVGNALEAAGGAAVTIMAVFNMK